MVEEKISGEGQTDQAAEVAESVAGKPVDGDSEPTAMPSAAEDQSQGTGTSEEPESLGVDGVPEELKAKEKELLSAFHKKTQAMSQTQRDLESKYGQYQKDAETLYKLADTPWFKEALDRQRTSRNGPQELAVSDDEYQAITSNKTAFENFLKTREKQLFDAFKSELDRRVSSSEKTSKDIKRQLEFDGLAKQFVDFKQMADSGSLDKYLDEGLSYERAYKLAKYDSGEVDSPRKTKEEAERLLADRRKGAVAKDGISKVNGGPVLKAPQNLAKALDEVFSRLNKGQKDFTFERS